MNINWEINSRINTKVLEECLDNIKNGFYQDLRFYILNYLPPKFRNRVIVIPNISFVKKNLKNYDHSSFSKVINESTHILNNTHKKQLLTTKQKIYKNWSSFKSFIKQHINISNKENILISPHYHGTLGSYYFRNNVIWISPRYERTDNQIFHLITQSLIRKYNYSNKSNLNDKEIYQRGIWKKITIETSNLFKIFNNKYYTKKPKPMIKTLNSEFKGELVKQSKNNFKKLGYPIKPEINKAAIFKSFTTSEKTILKSLIKKKNIVLTFEEMGDLLWKNKVNEKYSLYAITKKIERIREKLYQNGIKINIIHTQRGKGYILYD